MQQNNYCVSVWAFIDDVNRGSKQTQAIGRAKLKKKVMVGRWRSIQLYAPDALGATEQFLGRAMQNSAEPSRASFLIVGTLLEKKRKLESRRRTEGGPLPVAKSKQSNGQHSVGLKAQLCALWLQWVPAKNLPCVFRWLSNGVGDKK